MLEFCQWLTASSIGTGIRESTVLFPVIETVHVIALALFVGMAMMWDLRLLGVVLNGQRVTQVARIVLPVAWIGFVFTAASGLLLFWAQAERLHLNPAFRIKMLLLVIAGLNPLIFHTTIYRKVKDWDATAVTPVQARVAAAISLTAWSGIVATGRAIAFL